MINARLIFVSSLERKISLTKDFGIADGVIREGDYLFRLESIKISEIEEFGRIENTCSPLLKIIYKNEKYIVIKILPEQELLETLLDYDSNEENINVFLIKLARYFSSTEKPCWDLENKKIDFNQSPLVMGILNVTPDSFSDGGLYSDKSKAIERALEMVSEGADIIDIGGESTRPGADKINADEELKRVIPVINGIRKHSDVLISIVTYKSIVAEESIVHGADIINDISSMQFDDKMIDVIGKFKCPYIAMHIQGNPQNMQVNPSYVDMQNDIYNFLAKKCEDIASYNDGRVIIDPGFGFGKTVDHNLQLLRDLVDFTFIGNPILIGISRKSFIGKILDMEVGKRFVGTIVTEFYASLKKVNILRVHDVKETIQAKKMLTHILAA